MATFIGLKDGHKLRKKRRHGVGLRRLIESAQQFTSHFQGTQVSVALIASQAVLRQLLRTEGDSG